MKVGSKLCKSNLHYTLVSTMSNTGGGQPHAILVPFPAQGHLIPVMQLASLLQSKGFFITLVITEFHHNHLIRSKGLEWLQSFKNLRFETMTDGLPPSEGDARQDPEELCDSIRKTCLPVFRQLLAKLVSTAPELPRISSIICDGMMSFAVKAGAEFGIPVFALWTASACGFMGYLQYRDLIKRGLIPFHDESFMENGLLEREIEWFPGMRNMRLRDMPSFIRTTNQDDVLLNYLGDEVHNSLEASGIIFNTFSDLEHPVLDAIASHSPPIYTTGPLFLLSSNIHEDSRHFKPSLWKEDRTCLEWLDKQQPNSVVYVNYGSMTLISEKHLQEFAWGLANSKHPFLWITRPGISMGGSANLPEDFLEETKDRCMITSWCPQEEVLSHPSVGAFLSHCGWNSTLESVSAGVPMLCWPFFAEQHTNCRFICMDWGMGLEIDGDVRREKVEEVVRQVMEGERGRELKAKALEWKRKAVGATRIGGSSYNDFDRLVSTLLAN